MASPAEAPAYTPPTSGWVKFAARMLLVGAAANCLYGVAGLVKDDHLVSDALLFGALEFWGGVNLVVGLILLMVAVLILMGIPSGPVFGILIVSINAVAQLMAIGAYPLWSVAILVIDGLILYGLTVHGFREPT